MQLAQPMSLREIAAAVDGRIEGRDDVRVRGISTDTRTIDEGELFVALRGERFNGHHYLDRAQVTKVPGVMIEEQYVSSVPPDFRPARIVVPDTLRGLGDLAQAYRKRFSLLLITVTGSNGKTTTKEILLAILKRKRGEGEILGSRGNWNNLVGVPLTLFLIRSTHRVAVLELGTNQPGEIQRLAEITLPEIGVLTNIGPTHLEGLGGVEGVAREKEALILALDPEKGKAILNGDDPRVRELGERYQNRGGSVVYFGFGPDATVRGNRVQPKNWGLEFQVDFPERSFSAQLQFPGISGVKNALAAGAAAWAIGIPPEEIVSAWREVQPFPQRMHPIRSPRGFWVLDDSYNANPDSVVEALTVLSGIRDRSDSTSKSPRTWAVLGEMRELGEKSQEAHYGIGQKVRELGIDYLVLLDSPNGMIHFLSEGARGSGMDNEQIRIFRDQEEIGISLRAQLEPGDVVLVKGSRATRMDRVVETLLETNAV